MDIELRELIKSTRKHRKLTIKQLAKQSKMTESQYLNFEKNGANITVNTLLRIFRALGLELIIKQTIC